MFDPLGLVKEPSLALRLNFDGHLSTYRCVDYGMVESACPCPAARYRVEEMHGENVLELEVSKDDAHNFHLFAYRLLERKACSHAMLSILGTDTIGFGADESDPESEKSIYHRILHPGEEIESYKYIYVPERDEEDPAEWGYWQDANGRWYMMTERSAGRVKRIANRRPRYCWEYENCAGERLLIELVAGDAGRRGTFYIYLGYPLSRDMIRVVQSPKRTERLKSTCSRSAETGLSGRCETVTG